jgi:hypothetical protein
MNFGIFAEEYSACDLVLIKLGLDGLWVLAYDGRNPRSSILNGRSDGAPTENLG